MKVSELIQALQKLDPDAEVFTSIDDEGNGYRRVYNADCVSPGRVDESSLDHGHTESFYFDDWSDADCLLEPGERDGMVKAICIG